MGAPSRCQKLLVGMVAPVVFASHCRTGNGHRRTSLPGSVQLTQGGAASQHIQSL